MAQSPFPIAQAAAACRTDNPFFATTVFGRGKLPDAPEVIAFHDTTDNRNGWIQLATHAQVGSVYGVATSTREWEVLVAASLKRGAPIGPGGIRQIYRIDVDNLYVEQFVKVIGVGPDPRDFGSGTWPDDVVVPLIGRRGIGDIDLNADGTELFAMNLDTRQVHVYRTSEPAQIATWDVGSARESWASDARPFALKVRGSKVYHGVVRSAASSQDRTELRAYVYETGTTGGQPRVVAEFPLDYERGEAYDAVSAGWQPWRDSVLTLDPADRRGVYPQPLLADIEFTDSGDMILGLRDRYGDMAWDLPAEGMPPGERPAGPAGDILIGRRQGDRWVVDTSDEFYAEDAGPGVTRNGVQDELPVGGLARVIVSDVVVTTALSPFALGSGGALWFMNPSGENNRREPLHAADPVNRFLNANGLGDVEILCGPLPRPDPGGGFPTRVPSATATASRTSTPTDTPIPSATPTSTSTSSATATQTATVPPPTPTRTATATQTRTRTATPTRPTPTPARWTAWLPFNFQAPSCRLDARYVDVALVLDRSTSMLRPVTPGGLPKNAAAVSAARRFAELMRLRPGSPRATDRVAVIGFNDRAWLETGLSADPSVVGAALDRVELVAEEGTRLDLALRAAEEGLKVARSPGTSGVAILLTDGLPNRVPTPVGGGSQEQTVLAAAAALKAGGARVITVGVGQDDDLLHWLLEAAASAPTDYYFAPDSSDLVSVYEQIAGSVRTCRR